MLQLLQVSHELATPTLDPDTLAAAGKWLPAAELVQLLHRAESLSLTGSGMAHQ